MNQKIGVLDSGIGGTTVLKEIIKLLPNEEYVYYADTKNNPYGEKSEEELFNIVSKIVEFLINEKNCKMIVLACNTATTRCMKRLKKKYPNMLFVGTVPAIKVVTDHKFKNTLVLATPATIESERTKELIEVNKKGDQEITLISCKDLANAIERKDKAKIKSILLDLRKKTKDKKIDSIVLGCTHYSLIKKEIQSYFQDAILLDGAFGVAKEVKRQLTEHHLLNKRGDFQIDYIDSKEEISLR